MGLFDYVHSSYDLGDQFTNVELQTKDLNCFMFYYWISPAGELFEIDYSGTADMVETPDTFYPFKWVPNGNHGKITPVYVRKVVRLCPTHFDGNYEQWPDVWVYFKYGKIQEFWTEPINNKTIGG